MRNRRILVNGEKVFLFKLVFVRNKLDPLFLDFPS